MRDYYKKMSKVSITKQSIASAIRYMGQIVNSMTYINKETADAYGGNTTELAFLHSIGHAIDRILYYVVTNTDKSENVNTNYTDYDSDTFTPIFNEEHEKLFNSVEVNQSKRCVFASAFAFAYYVMGNSDLKTYMPKTYAYVDNIFKTYLT